MKNLSVFLSALGVMTAIYLLAGCFSSGTEFKSDPAQNAALIPESFSSQVFGENDPDMLIDGQLTESIYDVVSWLEFSYASNVDGNLPKVYLTGFTTGCGVYIASKAYDTNVRYGGGFYEQIVPAGSTGWAFSVAIDKKKEKPSRFRNNWFNYMLDCMGNARSDKRARHCSFIKGEVNGGATEYVSCEIFFPWSEIGFAEEERPSDFGIMPNYFGCFPGATNTTKFELQPSMGTDRTENYYRFGNYDGVLGYKNSETGNKTFGNARSGYPMTPLWDPSRESENTVECVGGSYNVVYFKDAYAEDFIVSTKMIPKAAIDDPYPKAGIYMMTTEGWYYAAILDTQPAWITSGADNENTLSQFQIYTLTNNNPNRWELKRFGSNVPNENPTSDCGVAFTMIKRGARFYYFVNGKYMGAEEADSTFSGKVFAGFYSLAMDVVFTDCEYESIDDATARSILNERGVYDVKAETGSAGGSVGVSDFQAKQGGSIVIDFSCKSGFALSSVLINGEESIDSVKENSEDGEYRIDNIDRNVNVKAYFTRVEDGVKITGNVKDESTGEGVSATVILIGADDSSLVYRLPSNAVKGWTCECPKGRYYVYCTVSGYNAYYSGWDLTEDTQRDITLTKMPEVLYRTWNTWYDEKKATFGTNNYNDSVHAAGVHFATESEEIFFSGKFTIDQWKFQGFSISSGDKHIRFMSRARGFNIWTMVYEKDEQNIIAENTAKNECLIDDRDANTSAVKSPETIYLISGSGEKKEWEFTFIISDDILLLYFDGILCYEINLTEYGFAAGSEYNVGIVKPAFYNTLFTVDIYELKTGSAATERIMNYKERL